MLDIQTSTLIKILSQGLLNHLLLIYLELTETSTLRLVYVYARAPLDEETIAHTSFSSGDKLYAFIRGFYVLNGL